MRVVVVAGHTLDAQGRLFIDAIRRAADLVGIVQVRRRAKKKKRLRRYARMARETGIVRTADFLGGVLVSALAKPRLQRGVEAALRTALSHDPTEGVPILDGGVVNSSEEVRAIQSFAPDLLYQCGPGITRPKVFQAAPRGMLHVHHGILPSIRGVASPEWAVREGQPSWLGVTLHFIDAGLDTGALVAQGRPDVQQGDSWVAVRAKLSRLGARLIAEGIRALQDGLEPVPAPPGLRSEYRTNLCFTDWAAFRVRLPRFLRGARAEEVSVGAYLPQ